VKYIRALEQVFSAYSLCGCAARHPVTGRAPLAIDHIDGNLSDHSPGNVRLVCADCHSLTPNYQALNKGSGRPCTMVRGASQ
jgi:hypothetical protein